jgi:phage/plasmid-like protein (TIGR03299 family)
MVAVERHPVWHGLGQRVADVMTAEEAIREANLDWSVDKEQTYVRRGDKYEVIPDRFAVTRDRDLKILGFVGPDYVPFRNAEAFNFFDTLVDSGAAKYETAGALFGGKRIWLTAKLPDEMQVAGGDAANMYLYLETSHDGSKATTVGLSPVLIVCQNTLNMAMASAKQSFAIRHTESAAGKIQEARETLQLTFKYVDVFKQQADELCMVKVSDEVFSQILEANMVPQPKAVPKNIAAIIANRHESGTIRDETRMTAWGAVQSLTEWSQHKRAFRNDESKMRANVGGWAQSLASKVTKDLLKAGN